jgi:NAD(P)-dependent dehydrogenase (short-subunit alcohol dehydrogenase family)
MLGTVALLDLSGKNALVVGGGQGIGRATALALARAGAGVAVLDAEAERAEGVAAELGDLGTRARALGADVTVAEEAERGIAEARNQLGGLGIVVNIVGSASWASLLDLDDETWERDIAVNLKHHWVVARSAARRWIDAGESGALCMVGSISGAFSAANHGAYGAAKAGLLGLVRTAAEEWWSHGIRVNAVVRGAVRTPRIEAAWSEGTVPRPGADVLERMALPDDIAGAILFLVSDLARRVTGQALVVDGGSTTKFPYAMG